MARTKKKEPVVAKESTMVPGEVETAPVLTDEEKREQMRTSLTGLREEHEAETPEKPVKERKKRKTNAEYEAEIAQLKAQSASPAEAMKDGTELGGMLLDLTDGAFGNKRSWTQTEREVWAQSFGKIFAKYMPKLGDWQTDIAFAIATVGLVLPRLVKKESSSEA